MFSAESTHPIGSSLIPLGYKRTVIAISNAAEYYIWFLSQSQMNSTTESVQFFLNDGSWSVAYGIQYTGDGRSPLGHYAGLNGVPNLHIPKPSFGVELRGDASNASTSSGYVFEIYVVYNKESTSSENNSNSSSRGSSDLVDILKLIGIIIGILVASGVVGYTVYVRCINVGNCSPTYVKTQNNY